MGMKHFFILSLFSISLSFYSQATEDKVIYGLDERQDIFEVTDPLHLELAKSTAALVQSHYLQDLGNGKTQVDAFLLGQERDLCEGQAFADQPTLADCSGFLVAPNILVTAGHCIASKKECQGFRYVFDYAKTSADQKDFTLETKNVYRCKKIVKSILNRDTDLDFAVIELDRNVIDRAPLKFRRTGLIENDADLVVIGHPSGLPTKVAAGAKVRENSNKVYFSANLDTFGGNSGSAVFNAKTGEVEGILVRGEQDYEDNGMCAEVFQCDNDDCRGEDVTRITKVYILKDLIKE